MIDALDFFSILFRKHIVYRAGDFTQFYAIEKILVSLNNIVISI